MRWPSESIWEAVAPSLPGFTVEILPSVDSTNSELMRRARAGQAEPVLLVAEEQTAGRGRLGRQWHSGADAMSSAGPPQAAKRGDAAGERLFSPSEPAQAGSEPRASAPSGGGAAHEVASVGAISTLTFSLGLPLQMGDWAGFSLAVGLSLASSLHPALRLKWPNDLWLEDRKLGGILIETVQAGDRRYAVIGVGLNIAPRAAAGLRTPPAWLQELEPALDASAALLRLAAPLVRAVQTFEQQGFAPCRQAYLQRDALAGRELVLSDGSAGRAAGVDERGALLVHTAAGLRRIDSAEVSVRPSV